MRAVLNDDERRLIPWTTYPLPSKSSARYAPSCPVIPVMRAIFVINSFLVVPISRALVMQRRSSVVSFRNDRGVLGDSSRAKCKSVDTRDYCYGKDAAPHPQTHHKHAPYRGKIGL